MPNSSIKNEKLYEDLRKARQLEGEVGAYLQRGCGAGKVGRRQEGRKVR